MGTGGLHDDGARRAGGGAGRAERGWQDHAPGAGRGAAAADHGNDQGPQAGRVRRPLDRAGLDQFGSFDSRGIVPIGYAAFAFALGVLAGAVLRRTVPAMAVTLLAFTAARLAFRLLARPVVLSPVTWALALNPATTGYGSSGFLPLMPAPGLQPAAPDLPNAWFTSIAIVNGKGNGLTAGTLASICPGIGDRAASGAPRTGGSGNVRVPQSVVTATQECVSRVATTYHEVVTYQPAGRYWPLQWCELCVFLAVAVLLGGACVWRVRSIGLGTVRGLLA